MLETLHLSDNQTDKVGLSVVLVACRIVNE